MEDTLKGTLIVTPHFNATRSRRLAETFYRWLPNLGPLAERVVCYEATFDGDHPDIDDSVLIRGGSQNVMWQKEALLNLALRDAAPTVKYFAWIDHDIMIESPTWLSDAIAMIDNGTPFVQLFGELVYLDRDGQEIRRVKSREAGGGGAPGGAWIGCRKTLDAMGGFYDRAIVGEGDEWCWCGFRGSVKPKHDLMRLALPRPMMLDIFGHVKRCQSVSPSTGHIETTAYHAWHGDRANRQYSTRTAILKRHDYDPQKDVRIGSSGLLEWATDKPDLHAEVRQYFADRREDG